MTVIPAKRISSGKPSSDYKEGLLDQITVCNNICHITFPLEREDGSIEVIER
jgi:hypothetical protein